MKKRILLVHTRSGPPLDFALPRLAARAEIHVLAFRPVPAGVEELCASVIPAPERPLKGDELVDAIVAAAGQVGADALCGLSEYTVVPVALAAEKLGLPGPGAGAASSRDKRLMRDAWAEAGVPQPAYRAVASAEDLRRAFRELQPPLLLKSAWGAGSAAQLVISAEEQIGPAWDEATAVMRTSDAANVSMLEAPDAAESDFLAEEIIPGTTRSWWEDGSGYGDYLSVEGIVVEGVYHPVCVTSRLPTIPPFMELCNIAPCVLPAPLQRAIESVARASVDALGLRTCGTHTEIKLMEDGGLALIESAGRFGGASILAQIEHVYGCDLVGMLADALLGLPVDPPASMLTPDDATGAACTLSLLATNAVGEPWSKDLVWDSRVVDWPSLVSPGTRVETVSALTVPDGTPMPTYEPSGGKLGIGGVLYLTSTDAATLVHDAYAVLNGLEDALARGHHEQTAVPAGHDMGVE
ncbi:ATP-grasp domain-containing protein [Streptacidiphilus pinicola]|uniref:ATP-grasp domain-containing protein n=1 Tax=Streptacidiphilus pinicola TaxID=2219663 RepID=A0A2X0KAW7_9ACTN|nr:ATP-grasp domain-containing protein [Streptacidiphilus pinicola]RAG84200.1 ATP-grasp domain-containing protein [Streptacidiphilus pinicola]